MECSEEDIISSESNNNNCKYKPQTESSYCLFFPFLFLLNFLPLIFLTIVTLKYVFITLLLLPLSEKASLLANLLAQKQG